MENLAIFSRFIEGTADQKPPLWVYKLENTDESSQQINSAENFLGKNEKGDLEFSVEYYVGPSVAVEFDLTNLRLVFSKQAEPYLEQCQFFSKKELEFQGDIPYGAFNTDTMTAFYKDSWHDNTENEKPDYLNDSGPHGLAVILGMYNAFFRNIEPYSHFSVSVIWENRLISISLKDFHEFRSQDASVDSSVNQFLRQYFNTFKLVKVFGYDSDKAFEKYKASPGLISIVFKENYDEADLSISIRESLCYGELVYNSNELLQVEGVWLAPSLLELLRYEIGRCVLWHSDQFQKVQDKYAREKAQEERENRADREEGEAFARKEARSEMYSDDPDWSWNID